MSRNFLNRPYSPWRGTPQSVEISLCKPTVAPRAMVVLIDWTTGQYGSAVKVDLSPQGASQPLDKIVCLKIDNSGNTGGLFIQFPDTSDVITVLPFSIDIVPVLTNQMTFVVYLANPSALTPVVRIHALNVYIDPSQELEQVLVSQTGANSVGGTSINVLGDVQEVLGIDLTSTAPQNIFNIPPLGSDDLIITSIQAYAYGCYNMTGIEAFIRLSDAFGFPVKQWAFGVTSNLDRYGHTSLEDSSGYQLKLPSSGAPYFIKNMVALTHGFFYISIEATRTDLV